LKKFILIFWIFFNSYPSFSDQNKIAEELYNELRCLVCQNQSIKESDAPLAKDLKIIVLEQLKNGKSKAEVKSFLVEKYGEFILFKPTFSVKNIFLWIAPIIFLLFGIIILYRYFYFQSKIINNDDNLSISEKKKLKNILDEEQNI